MFTQGGAALFTEVLRRHLLGNHTDQYAAPSMSIRLALQAVAIRSNESAYIRGRLKAAEDVAGGRDSSRSPRLALFICSQMNFRQITFSETQRTLSHHRHNLSKKWSKVCTDSKQEGCEHSSIRSRMGGALERFVSNGGKKERSKRKDAYQE